MPPSKLPIHYFTRARVVGHALVDPTLVERVQSHPWFISDKRRKSTPKLVLPNPHTGDRMNLYLGRTLLALGLHPQFTLATPQSAWEVWRFLQGFPPVRFRNGDPWDCRLENLVNPLGASPPSSALERPPSRKAQGPSVGKPLPGLPETHTPEHYDPDPPTDLDDFQWEPDFREVPEDFASDPTSDILKFFDTPSEAPKGLTQRDLGKETP